MNQQSLIMDLDDTLIHCSKYFRKSKNQFADQMLDWFHSATKEEILQKQLEIDLKNVEEFGLHSSLYPESLVLTYKYFCVKYGRGISDFEIKHVHSIGQSVFQIDVQPFPYLYEVLERLQEDGHDLVLFTGGDEENQRRKINQLGLENYFGDRVFICEQKNSYALQMVLDEIATEKYSTWMVGNSLKTDIKPAIELGINAIHIPAEIDWSYNILDIDIEPNGTFAELQSLLQLPEYLRDYAFYQVAK
ncbi:HAD family hydrolase [Paenibacillus sp. BSR1-1]|uniref:HAD family hydrolase n=1 Tax=Paenibacillus sp. BSR1-1 TaxID=3020845 RepID=UPI0025AF58DC|nr:HAD family hydrolase [Paenibacillus sp. BSR1-1]MDN3015389.1 HAD family hydrolase [Paenibacillus sp. BSR1-1]